MDFLSSTLVVCCPPQNVLSVSCVLAASGGCLHPRHHDGCAGGDGLRGPATEPTAAEETQLQPAGRSQRAGAADGQRLVLHTLLTGGRS